MRASVLSAALTAALLLSPVAVAQDAPPPPEPEAAPEAPPQPEADPGEAALDEKEEPKLICRSVRDPGTRRVVRKCETEAERERRLSSFRKRR